MDKKENKEVKRKKFLDRFSKFIVFFCLLYGLGLTTVSYIFCFLGKEPLVDLSSVIVSTIVAPVTVWLAQNALCNIFEKNQLAFSTPITAIQDGLVATANSIPKTTHIANTNDLPVGTIDNPIDLNIVTDEEFANFEFSNISGKGND